MSKVESLREIDKRVAVELGWTDVRLYRAHGIDHLGGTRPGDSLPYAIAEYTVDPIWADVVRQEIERRGWAWSLIMATSLPSYIAEVMVVPKETNTWLDPFDFAGHGGTWMEALCTAFLAACDGVKIGGEL